VYAITDVTPDFLAKQLDCIFTDIFPDAVKIGMVSNGGLIEVIADKLWHYRAKNVVLDTVMVSTSGKKLIGDSDRKILQSRLMPLSDLITPNIPEAESLSGRQIVTSDDMAKAAEIILRQTGANTAVLVKGGHKSSTADDCLYTGGKTVWYNGERIDNDNTHGTGCTLSSAIACNLALGYSMEESVGRAKKYLTGAIIAGLNLGNGNGPLEHTYWLDISRDRRENE
jgi:hydroxymethylpyrimidine/phosphomethylpyrimidine kinase